MAGPVYRIDQFSFYSLSAPPPFTLQRMIVRARPGLSNLQVQRVGVTGEPFVVRSKVDALTFADANALYSQYVSFQQSAPGAVQVVWHNLDYDAANTRFYILGVVPAVITKTIIGVGGLVGVSRARVECDWQLLPTRTAGL